MLHFKIQYGRPRVLELFTFDCGLTYDNMMDKPIEYNLDKTLKYVANILNVTPECVTLISYDEYRSLSRKERKLYSK